MIRPSLTAAALLVLGLGSGVAHAQSPVDGRAFARFTVDDGLPSNGIYALAFDEHGRLVLGTSDGLGIFDGRRFTTLRVGDPGAPPDDRPLVVASAGPDGPVWVITDAGRVQRRGGGDVTDFPDLTVSGSGAVQRTVPPLLVTDDGVFELGEHPVLRGDLPSGARFVMERGGETWVLVGDEALHRAAPGEEFTAAPMPAARLEAELRRRVGSPSATWTADRELVLDGTPVPLPGPFTQTVERDGTVWIATAGGGLLRARPTPLRVHRPTPPAPSRVDAVVVDGGTRGVWAALPERQGWWTPTRPTPAGTTWRSPGGSPRPLPPVGLAPLWVDGARWWLGDGIRRELSPEGAAELVLDESVLDACHGWTQASLLIEGGALAGPGWRHRAGRWEELPGACEPPRRQVRTMAATADGVLIGSIFGLARTDPETGATTTLPGPPGVRPRHLRLDGGRVWIATERYGLCVVDVEAVDEGAWRCLDRRRGFPETQIHASLADGLGRVWISTNRGLLVATRAALAEFADGRRESVPTVRLGRDHGLANPEFNGFVGMSGVTTDDGRLWFPSQDGLVEVRPDELRLPERVGVAVAGTRLGDVPLADDGVVPAEHQPVRVDLAITPLAWADQAEIRYRLGDGEWRETDSTLELTRLAPRRSTLTIQARLLGEWEDGAVLELERTPALRERAFFPLVVAAPVLLLLFGGALLRGRLARRRADALAAEVERQTAELRERARRLQELAGELDGRNRTVSAQAARLRELDDLKRRFLADIAHELRTPLTLVLGALEAPSEDPARARKHAEKLATLVDELFDLARLEAGALKPRMRRLDLSSLVRGAAEGFRREFEEEGRTLTVDVADELVVWADRKLLDRIVGNLIGNALRHGDGPTSVRLGDDSGTACLRVQDAGPGIPTEERERVFERFVQLSTGDQRAHEGAGIGLSMVAELSALHGGDATIRDGEGAIFEVRLPLGDDHVRVDDVDLRPEAAPLPSRAAPAQGEGLLLVEDNAEMRAFIAGVLRRRWPVVEAADGQEALDAVARARPRAIVSDVRMPRLDGLSLARALRADADTADLPILLVSAKTQAEDRVAGLEVADDYLAKPFSSRELLLRVEKLLGGPEAAPPPRPSHERVIVERIDAAVAEGLADPTFRVPVLAKRVAMSERSLQRSMRELGLGAPGAYILAARLEEARRALRERRHATVGEVAAAVGLSRSYFARAYRAWAGHAPSDEPPA